MQGHIFDYDNQRWTDINTDTDHQVDTFRFVTPDGVAYELNPDNPTEYHNDTTPYRTRCTVCGIEYLPSCTTPDGACSYECSNRMSPTIV